MCTALPSNTGLDLSRYEIIKNSAALGRGIHPLVLDEVARMDIAETLFPRLA